MRRWVRTRLRRLAAAGRLGQRVAPGPQILTFDPDPTRDPAVSVPLNGPAPSGPEHRPAPGDRSDAD